MTNFGNTTPRTRGLSFAIAILSAACLAIASAPCHAQVADGAPMLYFFTADGCAPCIQVKHVVKQLESEGYPVSTINVSQHPDWAKAFRVTRTPTLSLVRGKQVLAWQPRPMRAEELRGWFRTIGFRLPATGAARQVAAVPTPNPVNTAIRPVENKVSLGSPNNSRAKGFSSPTLHHGTPNPRNSAEQNALAATVRLQVKDEEGTSYATGTVVHSHDGESLVLTCGHVFRDSAGRGEIIAEFGFGDETTQVSGELLDYDANANDIALVAIRNGNHRLGVVDIASSESIIDRGETVFSIGCDRGEDPTIRHSAIKNLARYDGSLKYDIFGRPVNGRSGGGLFDDQGRLIGICNAAAVEVDEGIYTALETIHHQIAKTNLDHLFEQPQRLAAARSNEPVPPAAILASTTQPSRIPTEVAPSRNMVPIARRPQATKPAERFASLTATPTPTASSPLRNVSLEQPLADNDQEVLITIRSKSNPANSKTITISDPTPKLLDYLDSMDSSESRSLKMARYRTWR